MSEENELYIGGNGHAVHKDLDHNKGELWH